MIIIKISILYFIQIRHTLNGYPSSVINFTIADPPQLPPPQPLLLMCNQTGVR